MMDLKVFEFVRALRRCAMDNGCNEPPCPMVHECEGALRMLDRAAGIIEELLARDVVPTDFHERCLKIEIEKRFELEKQMPRWVSVEERLPEDQGDDARMARGRDYIHKVIAVSVTPNYTAMDTAYLYNGRWALGQYTSWEHFMGAPVTHWMPLPDPPKEVR